MDIHEMGDLLGKMQFSDTVLDVQSITLRYANSQKIAQDLYQQGWHYFLSAQQISAIQTQQLTYQVICGHAFAPVCEDMATIPLKKVLRRK